MKNHENHQKTRKNTKIMKIDENHENASKLANCERELSFVRVPKDCCLFARARAQIDSCLLAHARAGLVASELAQTPRNELVGGAWRDYSLPFFMGVVGGFHGCSWFFTFSMIFMIFIVFHSFHDFA